MYSTMRAMDFTMAMRSVFEKNDIAIDLPKIFSWETCSQILIDMPRCTTCPFSETISCANNTDIVFMYVLMDIFVRQLKRDERSTKDIFSETLLCC